MASPTRAPHHRFLDSASDPNDFIPPPIKGYEDLKPVSLEKATEKLQEYVPHVKEMVHRVKKAQRNAIGDLTPDEAAAITLYTYEWQPSEQSFYLKFNQVLRKRNRKELVPWFSYLRLFVDGLLKLPTEKPSRLYRGIREDQGQKYKAGQKCVWWSFASCSKKLEAIKQFMGPTGPRTMFIIECLSAVDITEYSVYDDEQEMLLYPGREFQVVSSLNAGNDFHVVELKEIEPEYPNFYFPEKPIPIPSPPPQPPPINILLLAPTSAGKATFINAFVNYLKYSQLEQARLAPLQVHIPLSFSLLRPLVDTEMQTIRLGQGNRSNPSQTCQSYFTGLKTGDGRELCLIDTPSFDDTVDVERNLQIILTYVETLTHLNGVCFVLKPDERSLGQLPTYFEQILTRLGPNSRQNVIICSTHARTTFFRLGSTGHLLKRMFQSLGRDNVYLFENAAFRYVMLCKNGITLDDHEHRKYTAQWTKMVTESHRLLRHMENLPSQRLSK